MRPANKSAKPQLTIRRRLNDFSGRGQSVLLFQPGCTSTCCCCCLHWVGAAAGAIVGGVSAGRAEKREPLPIHPAAKTYVVTGAWLGLATAGLLALAAGVRLSALPGGDISAALLIALAFVPSLAMLPVGAGALLGAALAGRSMAGFLLQGEYEPSCGMRFAWRIAWKTFLFSTLFSGIGYGLMVLPVLLIRLFS